MPWFFNHNLIHEIGGEDDTNQNTTRRLLLVLESHAVGRDDAYRRVTRHLLNRYLLEDRGLRRGSGYCVPRFLQNDFARYGERWLSLFTYKLRNRSGKGWAIRNTKLRMSRKLIYVSGLLACYRCHLDFADPSSLEIFRDPSRSKEVVEHLQEVFSLTPLEIVAGVLPQYQHLAGAARKIFDSYNGFPGDFGRRGKAKGFGSAKRRGCWRACGLSGSPKPQSHVPRRIAGVFFRYGKRHERSGGDSILDMPAKLIQR